MNTKLFERGAVGANILVGEDIDQLVNDAMQCVARLQEYYRNDIRQSLQDFGRAIVSNHSTGNHKTLLIVLDKRHQVPDEAWQNMTTQDIQRNYNIRIL